MTSSHRKDGTFRRGNRAAAKGADDRTMTSVRLPAATRALIRAMVTRGLSPSQADAISAAIEGHAKALGIELPPR